MRTVVVLAVVLLASCAQFENRVFCSPSRQEAAFISWYMTVGVGASISQKDAPLICGGMQK